MPKKNDDLIWQGKDCFSKTVSLYVNERDHIANDHPVMANNFHAIYETVETPDAGYTSRDSDSRNVYFKRSGTATYGTKFTTKVVVDYRDPNVAYIVTAFPQKDEGGNIDEQIFP